MFDAARPHRDLAALNTRLFTNALVNVDDYMARRRFHPRTNNMIFVALHLVEARVYLGRYLGADLVNPFGAETQVDTIEQMTSFPALDHVRATWDDASATVVSHMETLTEARWHHDSTVEFPVAGTTILAGTSFLLHHESYHLGQLGLLRKQAGLPAMSYV